MQPHDTTPLKLCHKCGETKPATPEYFHRKKNRRDGLHNSCKACVSAYMRIYHVANKERNNERTRVWVAANRDRKRTSDHDYYATHKEQHLERGRAWAVMNRERTRQRLREKRIANPEYERFWRHRRRARTRNAEGAHTAEDIRNQYQHQKGRCYYCKERVGDNYQVDHVVPLSRGGSNDPSNIVIACPKCNQSKRDKMPHEWHQGNRLL